MVRRALQLAVVAATSVAVSVATATAQTPSSRADITVPSVVPAVIAVDTTSPAAALAMPAGPALDAASVAVRARATIPVPADSAAAALQRRAGRGLGQSEVLMIVGGATFLVGAIVGDDAGTIIMIGGAAVGLYGLYRYLQEH